MAVTGRKGARTAGAGAAQESSSVKFRSEAQLGTRSAGRPPRKENSQQASGAL